MVDRLVAQAARSRDSSPRRSERRSLLLVLAGYAAQKTADSGNASNRCPLSLQFAYQKFRPELEPTETVFPFSLSHGVVGIARELDTG
jgi:hypothetical protein